MDDYEASQELAAERFTLIGQGLEADKRFVEAAAKYDEALRVDPDYSLAAFRAGNVALQLGNPTSAIGFLERAAALTPDHAPTVYLLSKAFFDSGNYSDALSAAERTVQIDSNHAGANMQRIRCLSALKEWPQVIDAFKRLPESLTTSVEVTLLYSLSLAHINKTDEAIRVFNLVKAGGRRRFAPITSEVISLLESADVHG